MHGVNKNKIDLEAAVASAGTIVVDHLAELEKLIELSRTTSREFPQIWLRLRPGLAVDTHSYTQTGQLDSKFGMHPDELEQAIQHCRSAGLAVTGLHFHQGSHFHDPAPLVPAIETALDLIARLHEQTGWLPNSFCPGGGWGVPYHEDDLPHRPVSDYIGLIAQTLVQGCQQRNIPLPDLQLEPGRSLVARAGVAVYRVESLKPTGQRRWLLLDGGLADNPRPALYGARYSCLPVCDLNRDITGPAWLAGPFCESGDILIEDLPMPDVEAGELVAVPVSGAYQLSMGSNYNGARRPAVVWLNQGRSTLIQRRETLSDLMRRDLPLKFPQLRMRA
jgi:diaminopimelate decarboxylase